MIGFFSGLKAGSILLIAFGLDNLLEIISGSALIWRVRKSAARVNEHVIGRAEKISSLIMGLLLLALAVYITIISAYNLITHQSAEMCIAVASVS